MTSYRLVKWNRTPCTGTDLGRKTSRIFRHILVTADSPRPPRGLDDQALAKVCLECCDSEGTGKDQEAAVATPLIPFPILPCTVAPRCCRKCRAPGKLLTWDCLLLESSVCVCVDMSMPVCASVCLYMYVCVGTYVYGCVQVCERVCGTNHLHCLSHTHWEFSEPQGPPAQGPAHWQRLGGHDLTSTLQRVQSGSLAVNLPPRHFRKTQSCSMHSFILPSFIQPWLLQQALAERQLRDA